MADIVDLAESQYEFVMSANIAAARKPLAPGVAGECAQCGEDSGRLVGGACAPCRDRFKLA